MSQIKKYITEINEQGSKALAVFLTAGFPSPLGYVDTACRLLDAGADILEVGIPFSDPLADGPIIQKSSQGALEQGITMYDVLQYAEAIKKRSQKKLVAMGYANPILSYGVQRFLTDAANAGFDGIIVPDVPLDEYENFYGVAQTVPDTILLTTPVTTPGRILEIDRKSSGFLYYVSVAGTTGGHTWNSTVIENLKKVRSLDLQNKLMVGFGISSAEDIRTIKDDCDGVIVGSAIIKMLLLNPDAVADVAQFVTTLKEACKN